MMMFILSSALVLLEGTYSYLSVRAIVTYGSIFVHAYLFMDIYKRRDLIKDLRLVLILYISAGLIQAITTPQIFDFLVNTRTSAGRGVTSLTPEPSMFGLILILVYFFQDILKEKISFRAATIFGIFFLSQSTLCAVIFLVYQIFKTLIKINVSNFVTSALSFSAIMLLLFLGYALRFEGIFNQLFSDQGIMFVLQDASVNDRLRSLTFALIGTYENSFMPGFFHTFETESNILRNQFSSIFIYGFDSNKIMSGFGTGLYELGVFFLLFFWAFFASLGKKLSDKITYTLAFFLLGFSSISLATPLLAYFTVINKE